MGGSKKTSNTTTVNLSDEAKAMIAAQYGQYNNSLGKMDSLLNQYTNSQSNNTSYDWDSIENNYTSKLNDLASQYQDLANGTVSDAYKSNMGNYYNSVYNNTLGKTVNSLGTRGVLDSSITNESISDMQKNLSAQESKDYTNYLTNQSTLLNNLATNYKDKYNSYATSQSNANNETNDLLNAYLQLYNSGNSTLSDIGNLTKSTTTTSTTSDGGFGDFLTSILSGAASGYAKTL